MKKPYKPIWCLDFDGVIHSYESGWKGATIIPDSPVDGAIEFILSGLKAADIAILSSRSHQWGGRRAMKKWLRKELWYWLNSQSEKNGKSWKEILTAFELAEFEQGMELWEIAANEWCDSVIKKIKWPLFKPAATITIDDRALTFTGKWPEMDEIKQFKPWNKRPSVVTG